MIEKIKGEFLCVSCAKETPVKFVIKDINNEVLCSLPLCRECSDAFASDRSDILKRKFEAKKETIEETLKTTDINWNDTGKKDRTIRIYHSCDITNPKERDSAIRWLFSNALKMKSLVEKIC